MDLVRGNGVLHHSSAGMRDVAGGVVTHVEVAGAQVLPELVHLRVVHLVLRAHVIGNRLSRLSIQREEMLHIVLTMPDGEIGFVVHRFGKSRFTTTVFLFSHGWSLHIFRGWRSVLDSFESGGVGTKFEI